MPVLKIKTQVHPDFAVSQGKYHDEQAIMDVADYVLRSDKAPSQLAGGIAMNPLLAKEQFGIVAQAYGKDFGVRLRHMILSFGPNEQISLIDAKNIAYQAAAYYGGQYQILWGCHTDGSCLHIHFVMNTVSYLTGRKYDGSKADYYGFQSHLNRVLEPYGLYLITVKDTA